MLVDLAIKSDTLARWTLLNPVLPKGMPALEEDTHRLRMGDGVHPFLELPVWAVDPVLMQAITDAAIAAAAAAELARDEAVAAAGGGTIATETTPGVMALATAGEVTTGTEAAKAVTPATLAARLAAVTTPPDATTSVKGIAFLATTGEATAGTNATKAVTPAGVAAALANANVVVTDASTTVKGVVYLATNAEATAGANTVKPVVPAALKAALDARTGTTTATGLVRLATTAEAITGTAVDRVVTPAGVTAAIGAIPTGTTGGRGLVMLATGAEALAGTDTSKVLTAAALAAALSGFTGFDARYYTETEIDAKFSGYPTVTDAVNAVVVTSATPDPGTYVKRADDGSFPVPSPTGPDRPTPKAYVDALVGGGGSGGTVVRTYTMSTASSSSATTPTPIALTPVRSSDPATFNDAALGDVIIASVVLSFTAASASGIVVRAKSPGSTLTNQVTNPSVESDLSGWHVSSQAHISRESGTAADGIQALRVDVDTAGAVWVWNDWIAWAGDAPFSVGSKFRRISSIARTCRCDAIWTTDPSLTNADSGSTASSKNGTGITPGTGAYTQAKAENAVPTGAVKVRQRNVIVAAAPGDAFYIDAMQVEPFTTLPAFGNTASGGSLLTAAPASWSKVGLGTTSENVYAEFLLKVNSAAAPLDLEFLQLNSNATPTVITGGWVTYAKVSA